MFSESISNPAPFACIQYGVDCTAIAKFPVYPVYWSLATNSSRGRKTLTDKGVLNITYFSMSVSLCPIDEKLLYLIKVLSAFCML